MSEENGDKRPKRSKRLQRSQRYLCPRDKPKLGARHSTLNVMTLSKSSLLKRSTINKCLDTISIQVTNNQIFVTRLLQTLYRLHPRPSISLSQSLSHCLSISLSVYLSLCLFIHTIVLCFHSRYGVIILCRLFLEYIIIKILPDL